jgi:hypothetical protein
MAEIVHQGFLEKGGPLCYSKVKFGDRTISNDGAFGHVINCQKCIEINKAYWPYKKSVPRAMEVAHLRKNAAIVTKLCRLGKLDQNVRRVPGKNLTNEELGAMHYIRDKMRFNK